MELEPLGEVVPDASGGATPVEDVHIVGRNGDASLMEEEREEASPAEQEPEKRRKSRLKLRKEEWSASTSSKVMPQQFQVGEPVIRKVHPYELENKLSPKGTVHIS